MASMNLFFSPTVIVTPQKRVVRTAATAVKTSGGSSQEKGLLDFILGGLTKEDQFYETDPILKKVEDKNTTAAVTRKNPVAVAPTKKSDGGFGFGLGDLFSKK